MAAAADAAASAGQALLDRAEECTASGDSAAAEQLLRQVLALGERMDRSLALSASLLLTDGVRRGRNYPISILLLAGGAL